MPPRARIVAVAAMAIGLPSLSLLPPLEFLLAPPLPTTAAAGPASGLQRVPDDERRARLRCGIAGGVLAEEDTPVARVQCVPAAETKWAEGRCRTKHATRLALQRRRVGAVHGGALRTGSGSRHS